MTSKQKTMLGAVLLAALGVLRQYYPELALEVALIMAALGGAGLASGGLWKNEKPTGLDLELPGPKGDGGAGGFVRLEMLGILFVCGLAFLLVACGGPLKQAHVQLNPRNEGKGVTIIVVEPDGTEAGRVEVDKLTEPIKVPASLLKQYLDTKCPKTPK